MTRFIAPIDTKQKVYDEYWGSWRPAVAHWADFRLLNGVIRERKTPHVGTGKDHCRTYVLQRYLTTIRS